MRGKRHIEIYDHCTLFNAKRRQAQSCRQAEAERKKHVAKMQELAKREAHTWQEVESKTLSNLR